METGRLKIVLKRVPSRLFLNFLKSKLLLNLTEDSLIFKLPFKTMVCGTNKPLFSICATNKLAAVYPIKCVGYLRMLRRKIKLKVNNTIF